MNNSDRSQQEQSQIELSQSVPTRTVEVKWSSRWEVYRRLQALGIKSQCSTNEPLLVYLHSPTTLIQIWSVLRQCGGSRRDLIDWLENCLEAESTTDCFNRDRQ